jgi:RHS repeat-associated protein
MFNIMVKTRFDSLGVAYFGKDNRSSNTYYVSKTPPSGGWKSDLYYYHSDHLGSASLITDGAGHLNQHFSFDSRYKFTGKEMDAETGLYYFSQRYMDSKSPGFISSDELREKYPWIGSYVYCAGNPLKFVDPDGRKILFVNGHYQNNIFGVFIGRYAGEKYWGTGFASAAQNFFNDHTTLSSSNYIDGSSICGFDQSGADRYKAGYDYAKAHIKDLTAGMKEGETFKMVTHSEGSAKGAGIAQCLIDNGYKVQTIVHLSADEGDEFSTPQSPMTYQLANDGDWVTGNNMISGVDKFGLVNSGLSFLFVHAQTKTVNLTNVFNQVADLSTVQVQSAIGENSGNFRSWYYQVPGTTTNGTSFTNVNGFSLMNPNGTKK